MSFIIYAILYDAPCLLSPVGSLVPAMCNRTSCGQVHELPQNRCGDSWDSTLFSGLHIFYAQLAFVSFQHSECRGSLMTSYITLFA